MARKNIKIILILSFILFSCINVKNRKTTNEKNNGKIDTLEFNRDLILREYLDEINIALINNNIPDFIYDNCLDIKELGYCYINANENISLRRNIINSLEKSQLLKLIELGDSSRFNLICNEGQEYKLKYSNLSNLSFIIEKLKDQK